MLYNTIFEPLTYISNDEGTEVCDSSYLEVGTKCFQHPDLKRDEETILVYSALLSIKDNPTSYLLSCRLRGIPDDPMKEKMDIYFYDPEVIAFLLSMTTNAVLQSLKKLKETGLISILAYSYQSIGIKINEDLRCAHKKGKSVIKIYNRIFFYPVITKEIAMVYSCYLQLCETLTFQDYVTRDYKKIARILGYSKQEIIHILNDMVHMGLVTIIKRSNLETVLLLVDFSQKQPEENIHEMRIKEQKEQETLKEEREELTKAALQNDLKKFETWVPTRDNNGSDPWDITMGDGETEYVNGWKSKELLRILESSDVWKKADQQAGALI